MLNAESFDPTDVERLRKILNAKKQELLNLYQHDIRGGQEATDDNSDDFADRANNSYNREMMFALSNTEREMLLYIDEAFRKLAGGTYGRCQHCKELIGTPRLEALPWARYCISCQEREEMGLLEED